MKRNFINFEHEGRILKAVANPPSYAGCSEVAERLEQEGLSLTTLSEGISLINHAWKNLDQDPLCKIVMETVSESAGDCGMWINTGNLFMPGEGIYTENFPTFEKEKNSEAYTKQVIMDKEDLDKRLGEKDSNVTLTPLGFEYSFIDYSNITKHPYLINTLGINGIKKLLEIIEHHNGFSIFPLSGNHQITTMCQLMVNRHNMFQLSLNYSGWGSRGLGVIREN